MKHKMTSVLFTALLLLVALGSRQEARAGELLKDYGIHFEHGTWAQAVAKAKSEGKLIFVDFYTQWCGPCYNMAKTVFTQPAVGEMYNTHFVCMKIDAEHGEGVELARKYGVRVYPTYFFIDPQTEEPVHRSSSTQTAETFIQTGSYALKPETRSYFLEKAYDEGNRSRDVLIAYINYQHSIHQRDKVTQAFDALLAAGAQLTEPEIWELFVRCVSGVSKPLQTVSSQYATFCQRYGKKEVDKKFAEETRYGNAQAIAALCDFEGKAFNLKMIRLSSYTRQRMYAEAGSLTDSLLADSTVDKQLMMSQLTYMVRQAMYDEKTPATWFCKCVDYARFIAYNWTNRDEANPHQLYASMLEESYRRQLDVEALRKQLKATPAWGAATYSMRPAGLKPKPVRQKSKAKK